MNNAAIRDLARNLKARSILVYGKKVDPVSGDQINYVETSTAHVTADEIILQDNHGSPFRAFRADVTVDIGVSGVNGLDSGVKAASMWYHIWIIANSSGLVGGLLSTSETEPALPSGYKYKAYVGAVYNNSSDYFVSYYQNNSLTWAEKSCPLAMTSFPTSPTSIGLSASVPSTAMSVIIELSGLTNIGGHFISNIYVGPTLNGPWHNRWMMVAGTPQGAGSVDHVQCSTQCELILDTAQTIYAYVGTTNDLLEISVLGWRY
jgi:hypothetical protein